MISDLIQDDSLLPTQKAEMQRKMTNECKTLKQYQAFLDQMNNKSQNLYLKMKDKNKISMNMYSLIGSFNLGNLSALP